MLDGALPARAAGVARRLRDRLAALTVAIEEIDGGFREVAVPSYADGPRPSSTVVLRGRGASGRGENVAWTPADHARFLGLCRAGASGGASALGAGRRVGGGIPLRGAHSLGDLSASLRDALPEPYDRAACEAAAIDLALRQAKTSLARLAEQAPRPVRYVVSLAPSPDPVAAIAPEIAFRRTVELKLDVDPAWGDDTLAALARDAISILDWKGGGTRSAVARARAALPRAVHEDPPETSLAGGPGWAGEMRDATSLDQSVRLAADVRSARFLPAAINVKPARMGGVLEAIDAIAACDEGGIGVYLGGMFELGVGRAQLLALAALLCPDGPNDIAPIACAGEAPRRPERLIARAPEEPGFA